MEHYFPENGVVENIAPVKTGVLLINLGSPDASEAGAVRRYLRQFLSDKRVIELPAWKWQPVLRGIILRTRPQKSAALYRKVWTQEGAPLIVYTQRQAAALESALRRRGREMPVYSGMTYGNPSVAAAVLQMKKDGVNRIIALPMFAQYAASSTGAALDALWRTFLRLRFQPPLRTVSDFHDNPRYIAAMAAHIRAHRPEGSFLLFSFHGIPLRHHNGGDPYFAQCRRTVALLAAALGLSEKEYGTAFQSRFGKDAWIEPCTQDILPQLPQNGVKDVAVFCPGFAADCLETLEEIAIGGRELFLQAGGEKYTYIPCLNEGEMFIECLADLAEAA